MGALRRGRARARRGRDRPGWLDGVGARVERVPRPLRFGAVGGACALLQLVCLAGLVRGGVERHVANGVAFLLSAQVNFALSSAITWRERHAAPLHLSSVGARLASYNATALGALALNETVFALAATVTHYLAASALGILAGMLLNYTVSEAVVFRRAGRQTDPDRDKEEAMILQHTLSLVLPAHNEAANLEPVVREALAVLPRVFRDWEILIVDDGSRDATGAIAGRLADEAPDGRVRVVHHPRNRGYGAALRSGFAAARGDLLMFMDADRQFAPREVAKLAPFVDEYDIVAGYRLRRNDPRRRVLLGKVFNLLVRILFGVRVRDIDCGFKILRADLVRGLDLRSPGALINTEIHAKAGRRGATTVEVGVNHHPRPAGEQSGGSAWVIARALGEILLLWWRLRSYSPPAASGTARCPRVGDIVLGGGALALLGAVALGLQWIRDHAGALLAAALARSAGVPPPRFR